MINCDYLNHECIAKNIEDDAPVTHTTAITWYVFEPFHISCKRIERHRFNYAHDTYRNLLIPFAEFAELTRSLFCIDDCVPHDCVISYDNQRIYLMIVCFGDF